MKTLPVRRVLTLALLVASLPASAATRIQVAEVADLSLEQLTRITVTSVSRREERLADVPASIFVITQEDIRRSGATSLPEALRLAPNLHVGRTDTSQYAIAARGGNTGTANKMLVLVDGRTIYTPLFSGVFWDAQDVMLEDIERIEVISGPAGTVWGTNGVNGVINITTASSRLTPGMLASATAGNFERGIAVRQGGTLGQRGSYRMYARHYDRDSHRSATDADLRDEGDRTIAGFRADWERGQGGLTLQGDVYRAEHRASGVPRELSGGNLLGRWTGQLDRGADYRVQAYYDRTEREHVGQFTETRDTFDLEANRSSFPVSNHHVVWGGGYRASRDRIGNSAALAFMPERRTLAWGNVFAQDEIAIASNLKATLGVRLERNSYSGWEWLPNARVAWQPAEGQLLWAAASRAVRAPSRIDRDLYVPGSPPYTVIKGNEDFDSEIARVVEVGWRTQPSAAFSFSVTAFRHKFDDLRSVEDFGSGRVISNGQTGRNTGIEGWGSWRVIPAWRLTAGFVAMDEKFTPKEGRIDLGGLASLGNDPKLAASIRSHWDVTPAHELDFAVRHVGVLSSSQVPGYTVLDARAGWRVSRTLALSLAIENLFDRKHAEFGAVTARAVFERTYLLRVTWKP